MTLGGLIETVVEKLEKRHGDRLEQKMPECMYAVGTGKVGT